MFVLSAEQLRKLLPSPSTGGALLDVGAGDGRVTQRILPCFDEVETTELSRAMVYRLRARGWRCERTPDLAGGVFREQHYRVVSFLNILDRVDDPEAMLRAGAALLRPGDGRLVVAVVLPFDDFVEGHTGNRAPQRPLFLPGGRRLDGASFEDAVLALTEHVFPRAGLAVERVARVPYLCAGDRVQAFYTLDDAVFVLKRAEV